MSAEELVPTHVAHTHIPCPAELRLPCLAHILRTALGPPKKESFPPHESKTNKGPGYLNGASEKAPIRAQPAQAIVFLDEKQVAKVDFYRDFMQSVLQEALFTSGDAMSDSPHISTNGVGVLLETMSLDARHATMQRFRYEYTVLRCT